ncbi:MAG: hypothetical protein Q8N51_20250, partial [Gammaproteobacteria bacterium]|nr:hypothetical protein [Gammaproteobacteria bacterium]
SPGHGLVTGDKVVYNKGGSGNSAIGGLSEGGNYFVRVSGNTVTLYDTKAHAEDTLNTTGRVNLTDGSGAGHNLKKLSTSSGTAVGVGIAINIADMQNQAVVGAGTSVTAEGVSAQALMKDVGGDKTHTFAAKATSGASGGDTGVAGSFALNYSKANTDAGLTTGLEVKAGAGDVTIVAASSTDARVEAKAKTGEAGDTGVGVSIGINIAVDNDTHAVIANGTTLTGGDDVTLTATGSHVVNTKAEGGGQSTGATGVGGALALTVADNETEARIGTGAGLNVSGNVSATANHHGSSVTTAKGDGTGSSTAVGVALALGFVDDSAVATTNRDITAGKAVSFTASADGSSKSEAIASAAGGDKKAESDKGKTTADDQSKSAAGLASKQSGETKKADGKKASTDDGNGGGDSVGVGAALALNIASSVADASLSGVSITAGEALSLKSENNMDASAIADASAALGGAGKALTFDGASGVDDGAAESITLSPGHGLVTGDKVVYNKGGSGNSAIGGLSEGGNYFVRVSGNTVTLYD